MKERLEKASYEEAKLEISLMDSADVIATSGGIETMNEASNIDFFGWT